MYYRKFCSQSKKNLQTSIKSIAYLLDSQNRSINTTKTTGIAHSMGKNIILRYINRGGFSLSSVWTKYTGNRQSIHIYSAKDFVNSDTYNEQIIQILYKLYL